MLDCLLESSMVSSFDPAFLALFILNLPQQLCATQTEWDKDGIGLGLDKSCLINGATYTCVDRFTLRK